MFRLLTLGVVILIASCRVERNESEVPYVLLVSFDGFRHDYVERFDLPNFKLFIKEGAKAEALIPSFPSKTFPNHYTLVTGLYPGNHGLVDNAFYDKRRGTFYSMDQRDKVSDAYYYGGTPLWKLVQQHGMKSASYFWVGSEIPTEGNHPDYYFPYEESVPFESRIDQVVNWLGLPEKERPHFITLYFSSPDHEGHRYGPLSEQVKFATQRMDSLLAKLMHALEETNLPVNVILVSDHGMKQLVRKPETFIFLDELLNLKDSSIKVSNGGTQTHIYTHNKQQADSIYGILKAKMQNFVVWQKSEYPDKWHYVHDRSGDLMVVANPGHYIRGGGKEQLLVNKEKFGVHGYDPANEPDMHGIFYARGPNINSGKIIPAFENIHVYPFIARILQLESPPVDGRDEVLNRIYR